MNFEVQRNSSKTTIKQFCRPSPQINYDNVPDYVVWDCGRGKNIKSFDVQRGDFDTRMSRRCLPSRKDAERRAGICAKCIYCTVFLAKKFPFLSVCSFVRVLFWWWSQKSKIVQKRAKNPFTILISKLA